MSSAQLLTQIQKARTEINPCEAPFWAKGGQLQTTLGHLLPSRSIKSRGEPHFISLENEHEKLHSLFFRGTREATLYVFHGLGGTADADYMQRTADLAMRLGFSVFLVNHRGCGDGKTFAKQTYHSGRAEDLSSVIAYGRKLNPSHLHVAIGFSLSANALLLLAAGYRGNVQPDVAIAVNGPIDLAHASVKLTEGFNRIYDFRFVLQLKQYLKNNHPNLDPELLKIRDLKTFDEKVTAPFGGFLGRMDYYQQCSAKPHLRSINIPTVLLSALDDPFVMGSDYQEAELSPMVQLHLEKEGGHMGYLAKRGVGYYRWLDHALETYLRFL